MYKIIIILTNKLQPIDNAMPAVQNNLHKRTFTFKIYTELDFFICYSLWQNVVSTNPRCIVHACFYVYLFNIKRIFICM